MKRVAIFNPYLDTMGGGERLCLMLAQSMRADLGCKVHLVTPSPIDLASLASYFELDLAGIQVLEVLGNGVLGRIAHHLGPLGRRVSHVLKERRILRVIRRGDFDLFVNCCYLSGLPNPSRQGAYVCMFPQPLRGADNDGTWSRRVYVRCKEAARRLLLHPRHVNPISSYQHIVAISEYVREHIRIRWNRDSDVLYPAGVDMSDGRPLDKQRLILHVGRFFEDAEDSHHKRHDLLIATFAELTDLHQQGWRLCLAGSVAKGAGHSEYVRQLLEQARGLPIDFRFDCSFEELKKLYNEATIYWHATGYGISADDHPERQEHFGITTVEAMSAGCIPVVLNTGGQREVVTSDRYGFLWNTPEDLRSLTTALAQGDAATRAALALAAQEAAHRFGEAAFRHNVVRVFGALIGA